MKKKLARGFIRFIGVACAMVGLGGVAGATETGQGFITSIIILGIGIILEYIDLKILE